MSRLSQAAIILFVLACVFGALYAFRMSILSFPDLQGMVLSAVPPGYADRFTPPLYHKLILLARAAGTCLLLLAAGVLLLRRSLQALIIQIAGDLRRVVFFLRPWFSLTRNKPLFNLALGLILLFGFLLRLHFLTEPLRKDEANTYLYYAQRPLVLGMSYYTANNHMLNTVLMHFSTAVLGGTVIALRLPTFIAGSLLPVLTYFAATLWYGRRAALLSLSLVSVSSPLIEYSFNARGYSLGATFFLLMVILIKPASRGLRGAWLCTSVCAALAIYSVPTMLYGIAAIYIYLLIRNWRRYPLQLFVSAALAGAMTLCLYAPALLTVGASAITRNKWVTPLPRSQWLMAFAAETRSLGRYWITDIPLPVVLVLVLALLWAIVRRRTRISPAVSLLIVLTLILCVALPLQSIVPPRRSYLYVLPLFCMAIGSAWASITRSVRARDAVVIAFALLIGFGLGGRVLTMKSLEHSGLESAGCRSASDIVRSFRTDLENGDQLICGEGFDSPLDFYIQRYGVRYHPLPDHGLLVVLKKGVPPEKFVDELGLKDRVSGYTYLAAFNDAVVYRAARGPGLPFSPGGDAYMGAFTNYKD